ncbi:MAG: transcriptional repressor [Methermicoccaceae archaeon]
MRVRVEITTDDGRTTSASFESTPMPMPMVEEVKQQICSFLDTVAQCPPSSGSHPSSTPLRSSALAPLPRKGPPPSADAWGYVGDSELTLRQRLEMFIKYDLDAEWFTSRDVKRAYEQKFDSISLSTVSTYLSRMFQDGILERMGNRNERRYRLSSTAMSGHSSIASWKEHE